MCSRSCSVYCVLCTVYCVLCVTDMSTLYWCYTRRYAGMDMWNCFKKTRAGDEIYFPTLLYIVGALDETLQQGELIV